MSKLAEHFLIALNKFDNRHKAPVSDLNFYKNKLWKSESEQCIRKK